MKCIAENKDRNALFSDFNRCGLISSVLMYSDSHFRNLVCQITQGIAAHMQTHTNRNSFLLRTVFAFVAIVTSITVYGQPTVVGRHTYQYKDMISQATNVTALGENSFGDTINWMNGSTVFRTVDVSIKTSTALPLDIGRMLVATNATSTSTGTMDYTVRPLGYEWELDVPYISGRFLKNEGWVGYALTAGGSTGRCTSGSFGPTAKIIQPWAQGNQTGYPAIVLTHNFHHGNTINIPRYGEEKLLRLLPGHPAPSDGTTYHGVTKSDWMVSCLATIKNGSGEGFVVLLPDGAKYYFDWIAGRDIGNMSGYELAKSEIFLYATKAVDKFGGTIEYNYDPASPHRLLSVTASDGSLVTLAYDPVSGKLSSITAGSRVWRYEYGTVFGLPYLSGVVLPDGSRWAYSSPPGPMYTFRMYCDPAVGTMTSAVPAPASEIKNFRVTHPSGAVADFAFRLIVHGYNNVTTGCDTTAALGYRPKNYIASSLYSKVISGPGISTQTYSVSYSPSWSYASECSGGCATTAKTTISESGGRVTEYVFGNDFSTNADQLITKTVSGAGGSEVERFEYVVTSSGQPFPEEKGGESAQPVNNPFALKNRPVKKHTLVRDGRAFSRTTESYDAFVRPTRVVRSSAPSP